MKRPIDKPMHTVVKTVMTAIYLWSGFFWCGITMLFFLLERSDVSDSAGLAVKMFIGSALILASLIMCWFRLYIIQILPCVAGLAVFLQPVREMMNHVANSSVVFTPSFELRYLPMVGYAILSLALLIIRIWNIAAAKAEIREEYNNRPSESIFGKDGKE